MVEATRQVDHIVPFHGYDDPLRLLRSNLQGLCFNNYCRLQTLSILDLSSPEFCAILCLATVLTTMLYSRHDRYR